jgi:signal transduction histidine kinase
VSIGGVTEQLARAGSRASAARQVTYLRRARVRLTIWYVGVLLLILLVAGISVYGALSRVRHDEIDRDLRDKWTANVDRNVIGQPQFTIPSGGADANAFADTFVLVFDQHGFLTSDPLRVGDNPGVRDAQSFAAAQLGHVTLRTVTINGQPIRLLTGPLRQNGQVAGILEVGRSLRPYEREMRATAVVLLSGGAVALILAAAGGMIVAGRALRPVQEGWQRQQAFVADASHELRTPLAIVRADAEVLLRARDQTIGENRELVEDIVNEADHLTGLVADMLTLARLDAEQLPLERIEFDARELLDDVAEQTRRTLGGRDIAVAVDAPLGPTLSADRDRILQVLRILVDNAVRHTPDGGSITLSSRAQNDRLLLAVADTGSGIAPEDLPHVLDRFYRADRARGRSGGAGLGLAIARGIVEAHGGRIAIDSAPGRGTTVTLDLPRAVD